MSDVMFYQNLQKGSSPLPAHGSGGASATKNMIAPQNNFRVKSKKARKKECFKDGKFKKMDIFAGFGSYCWNSNESGNWSGA